MRAATCPPTPRCLKSAPTSNAARSSKRSKPFHWSQTDAAETLRIPLSTLNQKIKRLNIDVKRKGSSSSRLTSVSCTTLCQLDTL